MRLTRCSRVASAMAGWRMGAQRGWFRYVTANHATAAPSTPNEPRFNRWHAMDIQRFALVPLPASLGGPGPTVYTDVGHTLGHLPRSELDPCIDCERSRPGAALSTTSRPAGRNDEGDPGPGAGRRVGSRCRLRSRRAVPDGVYQIVAIANPYGQYSGGAARRPTTSPDDVRPTTCRSLRGAARPATARARCRRGLAGRTVSVRQRQPVIRWPVPGVDMHAACDVSAERRIAGTIPMSPPATRSRRRMTNDTGFPTSRRRHGPGRATAPHVVHPVPCRPARAPARSAAGRSPARSVASRRRTPRATRRRRSPSSSASTSAG